MQFSGSLYALELDEARFTKTLRETLEVQVRQAARAWLRAVIPRVPVYTGMSRGSLQPLARFLRVAIPISPDQGAIRHPKKTPEAGASQSFFDFPNNGYVYSFQWDTDVLHYKINEYNNMSGILPLRHPTPWHSIEAGNKAFNAYIEQTLPKRLPRVSDFIKVGTIQIR
jgi:hypothetical protein